MLASTLLDRKWLMACKPFEMLLVNNFVAVKNTDSPNGQQQVAPTNGEIVIRLTILLCLRGATPLYDVILSF